ncbi:MAG: hypothetical protein M3R17_10505 [Bacteroidota bacterium]|nr:hypothetical protein [Bacteroidota bacterium]
MSLVNTTSQLLVSIGLGLGKQEPTTEERKGRRVGIIISAAVITVLMLLLLLIQIKTPIPPIPPDPETIELTFEMGLLDGTGGDAVTQGGGSEGNTGTPGMQNPADAASNTPQTPSDNGAVTGDDPTNDAATNTNHTGEAKQPTVDKATRAAMEEWKKNKSAATIKIGGDGRGDPYTGGLDDRSGSDRGPTDGGDIGVKGPGSKDGPSPTGGGKRIRKILSKPEIVNPTQEEGKVVVNVYVRRDGSVQKAEVSSTGTTTMNSTLRATATQSAYKIVFDTDPNGPELLLLPIDIYFTLK